MKAKDTKEYEKETVNSVLSALGSDKVKGLLEAEARKRLLAQGLNYSPEKEESFASRALKKFYGPIPFMIEAATFLSAMLGKWVDFAIILFLLFLNVGIDLWQESKALNALKVLENKLAKTCIVLRNGSFRSIDTKQVVPGDIVKIKIGNIVPADLKVVETDELQIDQSSLTGESLPVSMKTGQVVYSNSIVKKGMAICLVVNTGTNTYFGKTVSLVAKAGKESRSHLQEAVVNIGKYLIILTVFLAVLVLTTSLLRHEPFFEILTFVLVLTIAAIPVAMPAVLSVTLAVGALNLSKKQVVVSKLAAIEELAGMDVICFDKTGTLTQSRMSISEPISFGKYNKDQLMVYAGLCSNEEEKDPIENPIFKYLKEKGLYKKLSKYKRKKFLPFNPVDKRTEALVSRNGKDMFVIKGAIRVILAMCEDRRRKEIDEKVKEVSLQGMRTLAVAVRKGKNKKAEFVGLIPLFDPPRKDSAIVISEAKELGLDMKMVTGDNILIAKYISGLVGIGRKIFDARYLRQGWKSKKIQKEEAVAIIAHNPTKALKGTELIREIDDSNGFAEVYPEDKYTIVNELQKANRIVGMTGDGVNDSPALRKADSGIAVSGATDAAMAAADIILLNPGLLVIIDAIKESRKAFERMKSYSIYRIAETIRLILFITASIIILGFYPISPIMIILLLIFNDLPIMAIAYDNTKINKKPVRWNLKRVLTISTALGLTGVMASFGMLYIAMGYFALPMEVVQTIIFLKLAVAGHSTIYITRTDKRFWQKPYPAKLLLTAGIGTEIVATLVAVYGIFITPIGWTIALLIWLYAFCWLLINDQVKIMIYKVMGKS